MTKFIKWALSAFVLPLMASAQDAPSYDLSNIEQETIFFWETENGDRRAIYVGVVTRREASRNVDYHQFAMIDNSESDGLTTTTELLYNQSAQLIQILSEDFSEIYYPNNCAFDLGTCMTQLAFLENGNPGMVNRRSITTYEDGMWKVSRLLTTLDYREFRTKDCEIVDENGVMLAFYSASEDFPDIWARRLGDYADQSGEMLDRVRTACLEWH